MAGGLVVKCWPTMFGRGVAIIYTVQCTYRGVISHTRHHFFIRVAPTHMHLHCQGWHGTGWFENEQGRQNKFAFLAKGGRGQGWLEDGTREKESLLWVSKVTASWFHLD